MADFVYYVNPDSSGGNGVADLLSGATAAYQTLNAAVTARAGTHGSGNTITYRCSGNGSNFIDSTAVSLSSHTEDSVTVEGYSGNYSGYNQGSAYDNTAYYALEVSTTSVRTITIGVSNVTIKRLQVDNKSTSSYLGTLWCSTTVSGTTIIQNRIRGSKANGTKVSTGCEFTNPSSGFVIQNNTLEGNGNGSSTALDIKGPSSGTGTIVSNNTIYNFGIGVNTYNYQYYIFYNNAIVGCSNDWNFVGSEVITAGYNADSNDGDTPGTNNTTCVATAATDFTDCANGDFTVYSGGNLQDAGTSNAYTPSIDIANQTRS